MAASMKNIVWNFSRIQLVKLCLRQSPRSISSKATGTTKSTTKSTAKSSKKTATKASSDPTADAIKPAPSEGAPYTYEVPKYDDLLFYNVESDMVKHRIPQPTPGKP